MKQHTLFAYPTLHDDDCSHLSAHTQYFCDKDELIRETAPTNTGFSLKRKNGNRPWIAQDDPLTVIYGPEPRSLDDLFKKVDLIIPKGATPAIALLWQSKDSLQRGISSPIYRGTKKSDYSIRLDFEKSVIRGALDLEVILYLAGPAKKTKSAGIAPL